MYVKTGVDVGVGIFTCLRCTCTWKLHTNIIQGDLALAEGVHRRRPSGKSFLEDNFHDTSKACT